MKQIAFCSLLLLIVLSFTANGSAEPNSRRIFPKNAATSRKTQRKPVYYISIARANAAQFSKKEWRRVANKLKRGGLPAFFANHESLPLAVQTKGDWLLIKIIRRYPAAQVDALMLGPFASKEAARAAVNKLPGLLSDEGRPLEAGYYGDDWSMGNYLIMGERTK